MVARKTNKLVVSEREMDGFFWAEDDDEKSNNYLVVLPLALIVPINSTHTPNVAIRVMVLSRGFYEHDDDNGGGVGAEM